MELTAEHYRVAKIAYDAYVKQAGGVSLATGAKLPEFDALSRSIKDAWAAAGIAVSLALPNLELKAKAFDALQDLVGAHEGGTTIHVGWDDATYEYTVGTKSRGQLGYSKSLARALIEAAHV